MAIDTLEKRAASLTYGCAGRAGVRPPTGTSTEFIRGATLGLYTVTDVPDVTVGTPRCGWTFETPETVWTFEPQKTVWTFSQQETVWTFGGCR